MKITSRAQRRDTEPDVKAWYNRTRWRVPSRTKRRVTVTAAVLAVGLFLWNNGFHNIGTLNAAHSHECVPPPATPAAQLPDIPDVPSSKKLPASKIHGPTNAYTGLRNPADYRFRKSAANPPSDRHLGRWSRTDGT